MEPVTAIALAAEALFEGVANIIVSGPRRLSRAFDLTRPDVIDPLDPGELQPSNTVFLVIIIGTIVLVGGIVYAASKK